VLANAVSALMKGVVRHSRALLQRRGNTGMQGRRLYDHFIPTAGDCSGANTGDSHSSQYRSAYPTASTGAICSVTVVDSSLPAST
jgi:hypothetical protein